VKTRLGRSAIAGIGLFAAEFIPKGTCIWRFKTGFDIRVDKDYPSRLPEPARTFWATYAYQNHATLKYVLCADDARFFNHSDTPNTTCVEDPEGEETADVALRDIEPGEELTVDYREFDTDPYHGFAQSTSPRR